MQKLRASEFYRSAEERKSVMEQLQTVGHVKNHIIQQKAAGGKYKWVLLNYEVVEYDNEKCILAGITDINDLKVLEAELMENATIDILTGIYNRRYGFSLLEEVVTEVKKVNSYLTLAFIDFNNLKLINDRYGHKEGDFLIQETCRIIQDFLNEKDIFFRYGGDEFIAAFPHQRKFEIDLLFKDIYEILLNCQYDVEKPYPFSICHGLYEYDGKSNISVDIMIEFADQEMYKRKYDMKKKTMLVENWMN